MSKVKEQQKTAPAQSGLPPWEKDLEERLASFQKELAALLGKYELALIAKAKVLPDGTLGADPIVGSVRKDPNAKEGVVNPTV